MHVEIASQRHLAELLPVMNHPANHCFDRVVFWPVSEDAARQRLADSHNRPVGFIAVSEDRRLPVLIWSTNLDARRVEVMFPTISPEYVGLLKESVAFLTDHMNFRLVLTRTLGPIDEPCRVALEATGFSHVATLRGHAWYNGCYHDVQMWATFGGDRQ